MKYKWKPSKAQRREFAERMATDTAYNGLCMSSGTCTHFQISYTAYVPLLIHGVRCSCFFNF